MAVKGGIEQYGIGRKGSLYENVNDASNSSAEWFGLDDCIGRIVRVLISYYAMMLMYPISFFIFLARYNMLWEEGGGMGKWVGLLTVCFYPFYPIVALVVLIVKRTFFAPPAYEDDNVFFKPPADPLSALLWEFYKALSPPMAQFMINRGDTTAIAHSWFDHITHKHFWRRILEDVGAQVPRELGCWKCLDEKTNTWGVEWFHKLVDQDIVVKLKDESNGIGDAFLLNGSGEGQIKDQAAMETYLKTLKGEQIGCGEKNNSGLVYDGKEALILEWIRPSTAADPCGEQECHTLDIMTVAKPDGQIDVVTFLYWGDCEDGKTSHTTRGGYTVDVAKNAIGGKCAWYAPYFAKMVPKKTFSTGHPLPGMGEVCELMIKAHKVAMAEQPWLKMIGWDAMIARSGVVFFEGNFAQMRLPRRVFLTWANFFQCMNVYVFASLPEFVLMTGIWSAAFMYMFNLV